MGSADGNRQGGVAEELIPELLHDGREGLIQSVGSNVEHGFPGPSIAMKQSQPVMERDSRPICAYRHTSSILQRQANIHRGFNFRNRCSDDSKHERPRLRNAPGEAVDRARQYIVRVLSRPLQDAEHSFIPKGFVDGIGYQVGK